MKSLLGKIFASKFGWLFLLAVLFVVNFLASKVHIRLDLTKEKRYTLSNATKNLLLSIDEDVQIEVFLKGEFPSGFRKLANSTEEFLELLKDWNSSKIHYKFISPQDEMPNGKVYGDSLMKMGAMPINLTVQKKAGETSNIIFPVAVVKYQEKQFLVNLLPGASRVLSQDDINTAEALMEYQFVNALDKLTQKQRPGIAYSIGNGQPVDGRTYMMRMAFQKDYDFRIMDLNTIPAIPADVSVLMIVKPTLRFSENEKLKIDQFVMNGGRLLCFIDNLYSEMDSLAIKPETVAYDRNLNLTDLFFKYGARINTDLVMDLRCDMSYVIVGGTAENPQYEFLPWNYFPFLSSPEVKAAIKIPGYVSTQFANSIDTIQVPGVSKKALLVTSPNSRIISTPALISLNENRTVPEDEKFKQNAIPVAMLLEGQFTSLYKNRVTQAQNDSLAAVGATFATNSGKNKMIIVADGDMVFNGFIPELTESGELNTQVPPRPLEMGWNRDTYLQFLLGREEGKYFIPASNREFLLGCAEYLVNNDAISETRNKDIVLRLLDSKKVNKNKTSWQFFNIGLPILLVILFGWIYHQVRKRKYAA